MQLKLLLLLLISSLMGFSQTDSTLNNNANRKFELSLNVTTSISNFFGNSNSNSLLTDPYLIVIKYPGIDLVGGYFYSDVQTFDGISNTQIQSQQTMIGGGPMIGLLYQINQRLSISTEAALYYQNLTTKRYMSLGFPDPTPINRTEHGYSILPIIPSSIYFTIKL